MTRLCTAAALGTGLLAVAALVADAARMPAHLEGQPALEVAAGPAVRAHRAVVYHQVPPQARRAWTLFEQRAGGRWQVSWDPATGVPSRIFGSGMAAPGAMESPRLAAMYARAQLIAHLDLLAPGARADDFVLAANHSDGDLRTVGFHQTWRGLPVVGGQVSFRFKRDRLFVIGSEALPAVAAHPVATPVDDAAARAAAEAWIAGEAGAVAAGLVEGPMVLPLVDDRAVRAYHTVVRVTVDAHDPLGRWHVYLDAASGRPVARAQILRFAATTVRYNVPDRHPGSSRADQPARLASHLVSGNETWTDEDGLMSWPGEGAATVVSRVLGPLVWVENDGDVDATRTHTALPSVDLLWDARDDERVDAQLATFIHADTVKRYARGFAPDLSWLDEQLHATVNIGLTCNAYSDGETINFFLASDDCENTGRLADVIYHEFGHALHVQSILAGAGSFDPAFSEGLSDYLAATITGDPGMGRGFFYDDEPLRHLAPEDRIHVWPDDIGGVHYTGLIFGGAMWNLRTLLVERYGEQEGVALADRLFYAAVRRAADIPSTYVEILAADDDDGDLENGTPHLCEINAAFGPHGLRAFGIELQGPAAEPPGADGHRVAVRPLGLTELCDGDRVAGAVVEWRLPGDDGEPHSIALVESGGVFEGDLPPQPDGQVVHYRVRLDFEDGATRSFPDNPADRWYQFYVGDVVPLYCHDFETDPFLAGWSHGRTRSEAGEDGPDWEWGEPLGAPGSGDPVGARTGSRVLGNDLGGPGRDGKYRPGVTSYARSPAIEVGAYTDVRLQYWRWLNVEDAFYDQATIYANRRVAWRNLNSDMGHGSSVHHRDSEWRFHDVPISAALEGAAEATLEFELASDGGLEFGGWTIDDLCVVAHTASVCGDGVVTGAEQCDDGAANSDTDPDACRGNCRAPRCGDGVVDTGEECDPGVDNGPACTSDCLFAPSEGGGCGCAAGAGAGDGLLWVLALCGLTAILRRRHPRRC